MLGQRSCFHIKFPWHGTQSSEVAAKRVIPLSCFLWSYEYAWTLIRKVLPLQVGSTGQCSIGHCSPCPGSFPRTYPAAFGTIHIWSSNKLLCMYWLLCRYLSAANPGPLVPHTCCGGKKVRSMKKKYILKHIWKPECEIP